MSRTPQLTAYKGTDWGNDEVASRIESATSGEKTEAWAASTSGGDVHVIVDKEDIGKFYREIRQIDGAESEMIRDTIDDTIRGFVDL